MPLLGVNPLSRNVEFTMKFNIPSCKAETFNYSGLFESDDEELDC